MTGFFCFFFTYKPGKLLIYFVVVVVVVGYF